MALNIIPEYANLPRAQHQLAQTKSAAAKAKQANETQNTERLQKAAQEFENVLTRMMVRSMRQATPKSDLFSKSTAQEWFTEMLDEEYVRLMGENGGLGFTQSLLNSLKKHEPLAGQAAKQQASKNPYVEKTALAPSTKTPSSAASTLPQAP